MVQAASMEDMLASHLAMMFPEKEDVEGGEEPVPWDTFQEYQVSKLVAYVTFDGAERVQSLKEWKTGYSDYYGESDEKDNKAKVQKRGGRRRLLRGAHGLHPGTDYAL